VTLPSLPFEPSASPVRMGVVGLGYWGPNLVRALHEVEDAEVAWICDARPERLREIGRRYPAVRRTEVYDDLLGDPELDAVLIATPVSTHFPLAAAALEAGKHVFVEKPLAGSTEEAARLIEFADAQGLLLMPGHTFLYSPPVGLVRELIRSGELGDIYFISTSRVNLGLHQPDVSVAWDLGPHDFSILRYWLDETPQFVSALARGCILPNTPDVAFINLDYDCGTIAHVELAWLAPSKLRRTTVVGSRKMVVYDDGAIEPIRVFDSGVMVPDPSTFGEYKLTYRTGDVVSPHLEAAEPLRLELQDFCSALRTGGAVRSNAALGLEVLRTIEAVDASLASGGGRVPVSAFPALAAGELELAAPR
jgi:predicted dehydrogenase